MITITHIDPNDAIANGPSILNLNLDAIKSHIDDIENLLNPANNSIKLSSVATIPANSIEAATLVLTGASGLVFTVSPGGGAATASLGFDGVLTVLKVIATGAGAPNKSVLQDVQIEGQLDLDGEVNFNGIMNLSGPNSRIASKYRTVVLTDANMGAAATSPIDISPDNIVFLDYTAVSVVSGINFDLTSVVDGQEFMLILLKNAASGTNALYNGSSGNEIYAYINPASGFVTVSAAVQPQFTPAASPNGLSYMRLKWMDIGGGNFRLVVLEKMQTTAIA